MSKRSIQQTQISILSLGRWIARTAGRSPLRFAFVVVLVLQAIVVVLFQPAYETNDDVAMTMIAAGRGICLAPDEHLIFINVALGWLLKGLYHLSPIIPWYGLLFLLIHYLSQVALLYCSLTMGRDLRGLAPVNDESDCPTEPVALRLGLYLLYFALVAFALLNSLQFTTTAFVASQAGIFLLVLTWDRRSRDADSKSTGLCSAAAALLVIGGLLRIESLAMALLVAAPLLVLPMRNFRRRTLVAVARPVLAAGGMLALTVIVDFFWYECDPQWRGYRSFNQLRGKFHDVCLSFYSPVTASIFAQAGWSENDHTMIANWFADDRQLYSPAKLKGIFAAYPWRQARHATDIWSPAFQKISRNRPLLAVLLAMPFVLAVIHDRARASVIGSFGIAVALIVFVTWHKKTPPARVFFPLLTFPLSLSLLAPAWPRPRATRIRSSPDQLNIPGQDAILRIKRLILAATMLFLFIGVGLGIARQFNQSGRVRVARRQFQAFLAQLNPRGRQVCVCWKTALPLELISPWDNLQSWADRPLLALGWPQQTPFQEAIKRQFTIESVAQALFDRDDVLLIADAADRSHYATYVWEHFGQQIEFVSIACSGPQLVAGRFRSDNRKSQGITKLPVDTAIHAR